MSQITNFILWLVGENPGADTILEPAQALGLACAVCASAATGMFLFAVRSKQRRDERTRRLVEDEYISNRYRRA